MPIILLLAAGAIVVGFLSYLDKFRRAGGEVPTWVPIIGCLGFVLFGAFSVWVLSISVVQLD